MFGIRKKEKQTKVCLVILYNHNYEANIEKLERIYKGKFSHIFHLMPFYQGKKENVISVYQNSYFFCDYIRQGLPQFFDDKFTHYVFCADDLILNPAINETNIVRSLLKNNSDSGFITFYEALKENHIIEWTWTLSTLDAFLNNLGCQFKKFLPSYAFACSRMKKHGLPQKNISTNVALQCIQKSFRGMDNYIKSISKDNFKEIMSKKKKFKKKEFMYPLVRGFSDFIILPQSKIKEICHYFGLFSAGNIFVEVAVPTSMLFCLDKIYTAEDTKFKTKILWDEDRSKIIDKYNADFNEFYKNFEEKTLYVHPIKLSQWKMEK